MGFLRNQLINAGKLVTVMTPKKAGVTILIYHSISDDKSSVIDVSPKEFENQMKWLSENRNVISLDQFLSSEDVKEDAVLVTFDDGFTDYRETALDIMTKYNIPSVVYMVTALMLDSDRKFEFNSGQAKKSMNPSEVELIMKSDLVTVGSHTHNHLDVTALDPESLKFELETSYKIIKDLTGVEKIDFCYPWARYNDASTRLVRDIYRSSVIGRGGKNYTGYDEHLLKRIPIKHSNLNGFIDRVNGASIVEDRIRNWKDKL